MKFAKFLTSLLIFNTSLSFAEDYTLPERVIILDFERDALIDELGDEIVKAKDLLEKGDCYAVDHYINRIQSIKKNLTFDGLIGVDQNENIDALIKNAVEKCNIIISHTGDRFYYSSRTG